MTVEDWYVQIYQYATGWLGYTPDVALDTTVGNLELAIDAKFDFLRKTNPWRTQKDIDEENFNKSIGPENVARKLHAWAVAMQAQGRPDRRRDRKKEGIILPPGMEMPEIPILEKG